MASPRLALSAAATLLAAMTALTVSPAVAVTPSPSPSPSVSPTPTATPTTSPTALARITQRVTAAMRGSTAAHSDYRIQISDIGTISHNANRRSAPASNEKLLTTLTLLDLAGPTYRYVTTVSGTTAIGVTGALDGDLVLVGSGDPTLTQGDLASMARQLAQAGLRHVTGRLVVDDSRYSQTTRAPGWKHDFVPDESGTVDAFTVDNNDWRSGTAFEADPTHANAGLWRNALHKAGISVAGPTVVGAAPASLTPLVSHNSRPLSAIVEATLGESINFYAEMMLREAGYQRSGQGTRPAGIAAVTAEAAKLHIPLGIVEDGSGLSYDDRESPATFTALLDALPTQTAAYSTIYAGLPVSCRPGDTLEYRMCGPLVRGLVRAKTGTLDHISSLSGYTVTGSNRLVVFSFLLSGIGSIDAANAHIDAAVEAVVHSTA
jgi:D-alanyl-D-alanine carboxypeptidase/D-alanyl-D-alanine-endopeptidase (penicillin-binding protein 4)